ncbi:C2 and GRAM domain-containing protein [Vitis vinifera]|uniref:C2 and GRAM domain-containing protein n=1 Tax=Vitis vinifera TaxID=29760 RepID=A0A438D8H9_VITVI|nr:C2 and GRAM domain-containing protein [Vitis vinifera]
MGQTVPGMSQVNFPGGQTEKKLRPITLELPEVINYLEDSHWVSLPHFEVLQEHKDERKKDNNAVMTMIIKTVKAFSDYSSISTCFEEAIEPMQARNGEPEMPENLQRAFLLDQTHIMASKDLNMLLFAPNSQFRQDLAGLQGITSMKEGFGLGTQGQIKKLVTGNYLCSPTEIQIDGWHLISWILTMGSVGALIK